MKILIVNTSDSGGAANACLRLYEGLLNEGVASKVLLRTSQRNFTNTFQASPKKKSKVQKLLTIISKGLKELKLLRKKTSKEEKFKKKRSPELEMFSFPFSEYDITHSHLYKEADIINLHWVANFLDFKSFFEKNTKPVVWTLHDMNPFSGGEHYEEDFLGMDDFGKPLLRSKHGFEEEVEAHFINFKYKIFRKVNNLTIVAPSKWLVNEAVKSKVFGDKNIVHIPYGLNKEVYKIRDKAFSREILNIPKNKKVILFVAESLNNNNRKGFVYLKKAFELLQDNDIVLCAVGNKKIEIKSTNNLIELGTINDEKMMSLVYSAADVYVIPSLMDNLPNTVLESLMCGTPVVGFPVGGIIDMIEDGENGYITEEISVNALHKEILKFLEKPNFFDNKKIRANAIKNYDLSTQANKYINLYKSIINK